MPHPTIELSLVYAEVLVLVLAVRELRGLSDEEILMCFRITIMSS